VEGLVRELRLAAAQVGDGARQPGERAAQRAHELPQLVVGRLGDGDAEVAVGDALGGGHGAAERLGDPARQAQGEGDEHAERHDGDEGGAAPHGALRGAGRVEGVGDGGAVARAAPLEQRVERLARAPGARGGGRRRLGVGAELDVEARGEARREDVGVEGPPEGGELAGRDARARHRPRERGVDAGAGRVGVGDDGAVAERLGALEGAARHVLLRAHLEGQLERRLQSALEAVEGALGGDAEDHGDEQHGAEADAGDQWEALQPVADEHRAARGGESGHGRLACGDAGQPPQERTASRASTWGASRPPLTYRPLPAAA
jgi:hypothetical protein